MPLASWRRQWMMGQCEQRQLPPCAGSAAGRGLSSGDALRLQRVDKDVSSRRSQRCMHSCLQILAAVIIGKEQRLLATTPI
jgi:hypothetical protein